MLKKLLFILILVGCFNSCAQPAAARLPKPAAACIDKNTSHNTDTDQPAAANDSSDVFAVVRNLINGKNNKDLLLAVAGIYAGSQAIKNLPNIFNHIDSVINYAAFSFLVATEYL